MVETYDTFEDAKADDVAVGAVVIDGKPVYFRYENEDEARAKAFEIKHGRPYGEGEAAAKAVLDQLRPGWDQASVADLSGVLV